MTRSPREGRAWWRSKRGDTILVPGPLAAGAGPHVALTGAEGVLDLDWGGRGWHCR
jgi:hypothetical protein